MFSFPSYMLPFTDILFMESFYLYTPITFFFLENFQLNSHLAKINIEVHAPHVVIRDPHY